MTVARSALGEGSTFVVSLPPHYPGRVAGGPADASDPARPAELRVVADA